MKMILLHSVLIFCNFSISNLQAAERNETILQYFYWELPNDGTLWNKVNRESAALSNAGITALWLPPATKGASGSEDEGYGVYDRYDLGEFLQKGSVRTKYGTKQQYVDSIQSAHRSGIKIISDAVMNHQAGGDTIESGRATKVNPNNRTQLESAELEISARTGFKYAARNGKYSNFIWKWEYFTGADRATNVPGAAIYLFSRGSKTGWSKDVDLELGNFDYLLMNDLDLEHPVVRKELIDWGRWNFSETDVDGFRLDAVKHMSLGFTAEWTREMNRVKPGALIIGEYWSYDLPKLEAYVQKTSGFISLFDFTLQSRFVEVAEKRGFYDLSQMYRGTWSERMPSHSVTFIDNHDTWRDKERRNFLIPDSFKPQAYAMTLLRSGATPSIFLRDWIGRFSETLRKLSVARRDFAYGTEHLYFDDRDIVGWTREGTREHPRALAVVITDSFGGGVKGSKRMYVGKGLSGRNGNRVFSEILGNFPNKITVFEDGLGDFPVKSASDQNPTEGVSVWVEELVL